MSNDYDLISKGNEGTGNLGLVAESLRIGTDAILLPYLEKAILRENATDSAITDQEGYLLLHYRRSLAASLKSNPESISGMLSVIAFHSAEIEVGRADKAIRIEQARIVTEIRKKVSDTIAGDPSFSFNRLVHLVSTELSNALTTTDIDIPQFQEAFNSRVEGIMHLLSKPLTREEAKTLYRLYRLDRSTIPEVDSFKNELQRQVRQTVFLQRQRDIPLSRLELDEITDAEAFEDPNLLDFNQIKLEE
jgi:hypothetical protein